MRREGGRFPAKMRSILLKMMQQAMDWLDSDLTVWEYDSSRSSSTEPVWCPFSFAAQNELNAQYQRYKMFKKFQKGKHGSAMLMLKEGSAMYEVDLENFQQTNCETGRQRRIQCKSLALQRNSWIRKLWLSIKRKAFENRKTISDLRRQLAKTNQKLASQKCEIDRLQQESAEYKRKERDSESTILCLTNTVEELKESLKNYRRDGLLRYLPDHRTLCVAENQELAPDDFFFQAVEELMLSSVVPHRQTIKSSTWSPCAKLEVLSVELLQNHHLLDKYMAERALLHERRPTVRPLMDVVCRDGDKFVIRAISEVAAVDPRLNEALLFHGASSHCIDKIVEEGFDPQRGGDTTGAMYGIGTYFAHNVSKCDFYSTTAGSQVKEVLLSRVLLGETFLAERALGQGTKRAPDGYDSIVALTRGEGGAVDHREYVIFNPARAWPMFRVEYRHLHDCQCHHCG